jgi:uncharacterized protein (DUF4415 family)
MKWILDPAKAEANRRKHGLSFELAQRVFDDPLALSRPDPEPEEERWQTVGLIEGVIVFVVHTAPDEMETAASSVCERRRRMKGKLMKKASSKPLTRAQKAELARLKTLSDSAVGTRGIPEVKDWRGAKRGVFYKPVKQQLTLRLDADVIEWFKRNGNGYQTRMNQALRDYVRKHARKAAS